MRSLVLVITCCAVMAACVSTRRPVAPAAPAPWAERLAELERATGWRLDGRTAVAVGTQGWQASLDWRQRGAETEVHLAGPLGVGAMVLKQTAEGLSLNGAPPRATEVAQLEERLGFAMPLDDLRYWLLGIPDPDAPFDLTRNAQDRALRLMQAGWTLSYDRYMPVAGDLLPARLELDREGVRVRIAVDHWEAPR